MFAFFFKLFFLSFPSISFFLLFRAVWSSAFIFNKHFFLIICLFHFFRWVWDSYAKLAMKRIANANESERDNIKWTIFAQFLGRVQMQSEFSSRLRYSNASEAIGIWRRRSQPLPLRHWMSSYVVYLWNTVKVCLSTTHKSGNNF